MSTFQRDPREECFKVLKKIPSEQRAKIYEVWGEFGTPNVHVGGKAEFEKYGFPGQAATRGRDYYFRREWFEEAPEPILHTVIAHELAHSVDVMDHLREAEEARSEGLPPRTPEEEEEWRLAVETQVSRRIAEWGYDDDAARRWWGENYAEKE